MNINNLFYAGLLPITALGFIAVMLPLGTRWVWVLRVLLLLCSIHSGEYCKDKNILKEAAGTFTSKQSWECLENTEKYYKQLLQNGLIHSDT